MQSLYKVLLSPLMMIFLCLPEGWCSEAYFYPADDLEAVLVSEILKAEGSIDIASYSFSSPEIRKALLERMKEGVTVRILLHDAMRSSRRSFLGPLIQSGAQARWVTKILHHKFILIDDRVLLNSSANMSGSALVKSFDENLTICTDCPDHIRAYGEEFEQLFFTSNLVADENDVHVSDSYEPTQVHQNYEFAYFTSSNFMTGYDASRNQFIFSTEHLERDRGRVELLLAQAIDEAQGEVHIATGYFRSSPLYQAVVRAIDRGVRVVIVLDGREYLSPRQYEKQQKKLETCLRELPQWECYRKGVYFSKLLEEAGAEVFYKYYSFRWYFPRAQQMHHKYIIVDKSWLYTGSYNWSYNAEFESFENVAVFSSGKHDQIVNGFLNNFKKIRSYSGGPESYERFKKEFFSGEEIGLHFSPITLTSRQIDDFKARALEECPKLYDLGASANSCDIKEPETETENKPADPLPAAG